MEKVYHIYASKEQFKDIWETLNCMVGLMKTDYAIEDLSYEEVRKTGYNLSDASY